MAVEDWINLNFSEAIEYFRNKDPKPDPGMIQRLRADYHDTSFVVAGLAKADLVSGIHRLLLQAMEQGQDLDAFKAIFDQQMKDKGWRPGGARLQIIFDTNFRRSHAAGALPPSNGNHQGAPLLVVATSRLTQVPSPPQGTAQQGNPSGSSILENRHPFLWIWLSLHVFLL